MNSMNYPTIYSMIHVNTTCFMTSDIIDYFESSLNSSYSITILFCFDSLSFNIECDFD